MPVDVSLLLNESDLDQIRIRGISLSEIERQIAIFERGIPPVRLVRSCTIGDGILRLPELAQKKAVQKFRETAPSRQLIKFTPASGAATRMFRDLLAYLNGTASATRGAKLAGVRQFLHALDRFAFFPALQNALRERGLEIAVLLQEGREREILKALLEPDGLGYASIPKGLILFHAYPEGPRTAFEEHLVEANEYACGAGHIARLHFTVAPEHQQQIEHFLETVKSKYQRRGVTLQMEFSLQKPSTDTIAVELNNRPFRDARGRLLFRPGGHGALIENLNELDGDIVFIKNIDNVVPDRLKPEIYHYKKVLAGYLIQLQEQLFFYLEKLEQGQPDPVMLKEMYRFAREKFHLHLPEEWRREPLPGQRQKLIERLNRPIRVCGMVRNQGEPGGGPFWVAGPENTPTLQIVESAQVDMADPEQESIWKSSTHFNPVDLVCGVRDFRGRPFNLLQFRDPEGGLITVKSLHGRELKALELPGLWNGAMADWHTVFVEVPIITFNPVKTVLDLLRPEHQNV